VIIENGMVVGAEAEYDRKCEKSAAVQAKADYLLSTIDVADLRDVLDTAPTQLLKSMCEAIKQGDYMEVGLLVADIIEHHVEEAEYDEPFITEL